MTTAPGLPLPPEEVERRKHARVVRRVTDPVRQDEDTLLYWQSRTPQERLKVSFEMTRAIYIAKGFDAASPGRSERLITRIQRERR